MEKLVEWAKANVREGANLAEFEELAGSLALPNTKEEAWNFITKNQTFKSAVDAEVSRATAAHDERFTKTKLPEIEKQLRDRLAKELNPEETPQDKKIRELSEKLEAKERSEQLANTRNLLMKKASEIGFDAEIAAELAVFGDEAEEKLSKVAERFTLAVKSRVEAEVKKRYGNNKEPVTSKPLRVLSMTDFNNMSPKEQAAYMQSGGGLQE
jgi:hypothetical protein